MIDQHIDQLRLDRAAAISPEAFREVLAIIIQEDKDLEIKPEDCMTDEEKKVVCKISKGS